MSFEAYLPLIYVSALYWAGTHVQREDRCIYHILWMVWFGSFAVWALSLEPFGYIALDFIGALAVYVKSRRSTATITALSFIPMILLNTVQGVSEFFEPITWWRIQQFLVFAQLLIPWGGSNVGRVGDFFDRIARRSTMLDYLVDWLASYKRQKDK